MKYLYLVIYLAIFPYQIEAQKINAIKTIKHDTITIDLVNPYLSSVEFTLTTKNKNLPIKYKDRVIIKANDTCFNVLQLPASIIKDTSKVNINEYVGIRGTFGDPYTVKPNKEFLYELPYPKGKRYKIIQSFGGRFSHNLEHSKYAIDFGLQIGDTITAARSGIVILVKEDSKTHGKTRDYIDYANKIKILHDDGTIADYVHLDFNGALVKVGDQVKTGQPIGISGLTGFTTLPHLHFVVYKEQSVAIPIFFKKHKGKVLKKGKFYQN